MIHHTAIVDAGAELAEDVQVGPYAVIEADVIVDAGTVIGPYAIVAAGTRIGRDCRVHGHTVVGTIPQDLKFKGEETTLHIGDRTTIREFATLNRGTEALGKTVIGSDCHIPPPRKRKMPWKSHGHDTAHTVARMVSRAFFVKSNFHCVMVLGRSYILNYITI